MGFLGFGRTQIRYDMFDLERSAELAKRLGKCERIYHLGQEMAWEGRDVLPMLLQEHGGIRIAPEKRRALERIFAIIMWGELAAWKISAQLADRLVPLEAKMAATSQAHDEARHFYVMYDYLRELGYVPARMDRAPQALLDLVLETDELAHKLVGMQLMVETIALAIFQCVRESQVEPVLCDLLKYYERDEARHVGLGVQYLPDLVKDMSPREITRFALFQFRLSVLALWECKQLEPDLEALGIAPRAIIDATWRKQMGALQESWRGIGLDIDRRDNVLTRGMDTAVEYFFPPDKLRSRKQRLASALAALRGQRSGQFGMEEFGMHERHVIKTVRGWSDGRS
jgi:hypothetical protein